MITIQNLNKSFGRLKVLKNLDLTISGPGIYAILGPNGSGKTTLIKSILGMIIPDSGRILVNGKDATGNWAYRNDISYMPQIAQFPGNLRMRELILMIKDLRMQSASEDQFIEDFKLGPFLDKKLSTLSGGTKQKINIMLALMYDSPLIILDEPTTGLDPAALILFRKLIRTEKEKGKLILLTSHIMQFVEEIADEVIYILDGRIHFQGSIDALKLQTGAEHLELAIARISTAEMECPC